MRGRRFLSSAAYEHRFRDSYDYARLLQSSTGFQTLKQIHAQILTSDLHQNPFIAAKLVSRYAELGTHSLANARKVFDLAPHRDVVLYNVIIRAYATSGPPAEAVAIFSRMLSIGCLFPNLYTYPFVLKACAAARNLMAGKTVHGYAVKFGIGSDLFANNALIAFYSKCGRAELANVVFGVMPMRDLISWNSMISGYTQNGYFHEALGLLHRMLPLPDYVTIVSVLPACTALAAAGYGMWIHSYALKRGIEVDAAVGSGLIELYARCGRLAVAQHVFDRIADKNLIVYSSMMKAFGIHGHALAALEIFSEMMVGGVEPDSICFVSILSACSHAGLVEKGFEIFDKMDTEFLVEKSQVHYACMVDLLGRAGELSRALEFIEMMPMEPGRDVLGALLGACRAHNDIELGEEAAKRLLVLDPYNAGRYAALTNMYEDFGRLEDASRMRKVMRDKGVRKPLGCSMLLVAAKVHTFGVVDEAHPMSSEIYDLLDGLQRLVDEKEEMVPFLANWRFF